MVDNDAQPSKLLVPIDWSVLGKSTVGSDVQFKNATSSILRAKSGRTSMTSARHSVHTPTDTVCSPDERVSDVKFEAKAKAFVPMCVTELGMTTTIRLTQCMNVPLPIIVSELFGNVTVTRLDASRNASTPNDVTESGIVMCVKLVADKNAEFPISTTVSEIFTDTKPLALLNAPSRIMVTVLLRMIDVRIVQFSKADSRTADIELFRVTCPELSGSKAHEDPTGDKVFEFAVGAIVVGLKVTGACVCDTVGPKEFVGVLVVGATVTGANVVGWPFCTVVVGLNDVGVDVIGLAVAGADVAASIG